MQITVPVPQHDVYTLVRFHVATMLAEWIQYVDTNHKECDIFVPDDEWEELDDIEIAYQFVGTDGKPVGPLEPVEIRMDSCA